MPEWSRNGYRITTEAFDMDAVERMLRQAYWSKDRARADMERSFAESDVFAVYSGRAMVGVARVVTDHATFAWLCDVFVDECHRGRGLGEWLVQTVLDCDLYPPTTRWILATRDAHGLYAKFGFEATPEPGRWMVRGFSRLSPKPRPPER